MGVHKSVSLFHKSCDGSVYVQSVVECCVQLLATNSAYSVCQRRYDFKCLTFDCSSVFLRITLASMNGLGSVGQYSTIHI